MHRESGIDCRQVTEVRVSINFRPPIGCMNGNRKTHLKQQTNENPGTRKFRLTSKAET